MTRPASETLHQLPDIELQSMGSAGHLAVHPRGTIRPEFSSEWSSVQLNSHRVPSGHVNRQRPNATRTVQLWECLPEPRPLSEEVPGGWLGDGAVTVTHNTDIPYRSTPLDPFPQLYSQTAISFNHRRAAYSTLHICVNTQTQKKKCLSLFEVTIRHVSDVSAITKINNKS